MLCREPRALKSGGGGEHVYFLAPRAALPSSLGPGVDLLGDEKLVVAPPSLHASGYGYEWDEHPDEVELAALPDWIARARSRPSPSRLVTPEVILEGERNVTLTQIAGRMRLVMQQGEGIAPALHAINEQRCRGPLPRDVVEQIARSSQRWDGLPWLTSPREFFADTRLSSTARHVLRVLCDHANSNGTCWPTHATITRQTSISSSTTITKAIKELEDAGRITVTRRKHKPNLYRINRSLPQLSERHEPHPLVLRSQNLGAATGDDGR